MIVNYADEERIQLVNLQKFTDHIMITLEFVCPLQKVIDLFVIKKLTFFNS